MDHDDGMLRPPPDASTEPVGGDAACWLPSLCADCGAMIEGPPGTACWRCGGTRREGDV
ncbi:hypothetical protein [Microbacterium elymi]|uniref:Uncharacterized protein n=1 Tax=Microbacterium elymi TaxID=2909587 RepID=A0ABY5NKA7_9MICO|nr:hypothetical protein [Microbacterium elymi]UUT35602.1 hypothetical protein L2X98_20100 [Microbacterium elymi]